MISTCTLTSSHILGGLMRWKYIEINHSYVIILKNTAHCTTILKLNTKQKALFPIGTKSCKIWNMGELFVSH